ncbi:MAG: hypothetical protein AAF961_14775, partial [Planctomycetota bacterium]
MSDSRLPKLPSISELMEHPRVQSLVSRINQSTLAQRATGFLEEVGDSLARRTGTLEVPPLGQLAERFARRLLRDGPSGAPIVNASGCVIGDPQLAPPLADSAIQAVIHFASDYHNPAANTSEALLRSLTGAGGALVTHSFQNALRLVTTVLAADGTFAVAGPVVEGGTANKAAERAVDWERLSAVAQSPLRRVTTDVGALRDVDRNDLKLLLRAPEAGLSPVDATAGQGPEVSLRELAEIAQPCGAAVVDVCPLAGLIDPAAYGFPAVPTLGDRIASGADIVIADGGGLLGGPRCGVVLGAEPLVARVAAQELAKDARLDGLAETSLSATLGLSKKPQAAIHQIPLWQLITAPLDNLRLRAERIAALASEGPRVAEARPMECEGVWCLCGGRRLTAPTWTVELRTEPNAASRLASILGEGGKGLSVRAAA